MDLITNEAVRNEIELVFRSESRYALATLYRLLGEFDLAEDALQEAFASALEKWPREGIPGNPRSWLISTARNKAIDQIRRDQRFVQMPDTLQNISHLSPEFDSVMDDGIEDDLLRLIFMCCNPVLSIEAQVTLTLREVCGLSTVEVARAFLLPEATMAQRMVRAKAKLKEAKAVFEAPSSEELPSRLASALRVTYLIFNEGYYASSGESLTRADLSSEAIRLGEILCKLLPESEVRGLMALMCLSESRRGARENEGDIVLLENQDRSLWNHDLVAKGNAYLEQALAKTSPGYYVLQAMIAAEHANAPESRLTDWGRVVQLYDQLDNLSPSPVIKLNRAVAVAMRGPLEDGLSQITQLIIEGDLGRYGLAYAAQADLLRRLGRRSDARIAYEKALELTNLAPEKRFLQKRIQEVQFEDF